MKTYKTDSCLARAMWWALFYGFCVLYSCDNPWSWYKWCAGYFCISLAQVRLVLKGEPQLKDSSTRWACGRACGAFSWLMVDGGGTSPLLIWPSLGCGLGTYKKAGSASHEEQVSRQCFSMISTPTPASRFLPQVPFTKTVFGMWKMK